MSVDSSFKNAAAKEVINYTEALKKGYKLVKTHGLLTTNYIKEIQKRLEQNKPNFRKIPGTVLKNNSAVPAKKPPSESLFKTY